MGSGDYDVAVVNFGGQYAHMIQREVRDLAYDFTFKDWDKYDWENESYDAVILSGDAHSVNAEGHPGEDWDILDDEFPPTLGICYGHQLLAHKLGGTVEKQPQYGPSEIVVRYDNGVFESFEEDEEVNVLMSHGDTVTEIPEDTVVTAQSATSDNGNEEYLNAGITTEDEQYWGVQFHPEDTLNTPRGPEILDNFLQYVAAFGE